MWELYALRFGSQPELTGEQVALHPDRLSNQLASESFDFSFWLARSAESTVLIDCGFTATQAIARGKSYDADPLQLLAEIEVTPEDIDALILTHLHYDHAGNVARFPKAKVFLHLQEWLWATGPAMADPDAASYYDPQITAELLPKLASAA